MSWINNTLKRYCEECNSSRKKVIITSRGFHALLFYRVSNITYKKKIPVIPMVLTRIIQILYSIDIDYKAEIDEGLIIYHGVGLVIGSGVKISRNCTVFHNVTLGRSFGKDEGMPTIGEGVFIGTNATILGGVYIANNSKVGANSLVVKSFDIENSIILGNPAQKICGQ